MDISFIIPFFNNHDLLPECLDSIARHTTASHEIIIIDDGSPDTSYLRSLSAPHIRVFFGEGQAGPSKARNIGIRQAEGDYIIFLDSDDTIIADPAQLIRQNAALGSVAKTPDMLVGTTDEKPLSPRLAKQVPLITDMAENPVLVRLHYFFAILYRRDFLAAHGILFDEDMSSGGDLVFLAHTLASARAICVTNVAFYHYFRRENSITHSKLSHSKLRCRLEMLKRMQNHLAPMPQARILRGLVAFANNMPLVQKIEQTFGRRETEAFVADLSDWACHFLDDDTLIKICEEGFHLPWTEQHKQILAAMRKKHPITEIVQSILTLDIVEP